MQDTFRPRPDLVQIRYGAGHGEDYSAVTLGESDDPTNLACEPVSRQDRPQRATGTAVLFFKQNLRFTNELLDRAPTTEPAKSGNWTQSRMLQPNRSCENDTGWSGGALERPCHPAPLQYRPPHDYSHRRRPAGAGRWHGRAIGRYGIDDAISQGSRYISTVYSVERSADVGFEIP